MQTNPMEPAYIIDLISEAIDDSLDMDWRSIDAAKLVYNALYAEGLLSLTADDQAQIDAAWERHKAAAPHCERPPEGWFCTRDANHIGPCAARPIAELCPSSPDRIHIVDTSMESGPNNCFHCERPMK